MDKRLSLKLNGGRSVTGVLRGFDPFMNLVVDDSVEELKDGGRNQIGMVVSILLKTIQILLLMHINNMSINLLQVIRGNSIVMVEALDRI